MQITPSVDSAMFYFSTNALHFSEEFFGIILLVDGVAQVLGETWSVQFDPQHKVLLRKNLHKLLWVLLIINP